MNVWMTDKMSLAGLFRERLYVPRDLPSFDDTYQRHTGVLDTLRP